MKMIFYLLLAATAVTHSYAQCACCAGAGAAVTGNDYSHGALTLNKKSWAVEVAADNRSIRYKDEGSAGGEIPLKSMLISSLAIRYGITCKITLAAILPYALLRTDKGNDRGLGDLIVLGSYNFYTRNGWSIALQAGAELPTGIQKGASFDNTTVVVGSGSVDPMAGLSFSKKWDRLVLQGSMLYKYTTRGFDETFFGNLILHNVAISYRLSRNAGLAGRESTGKKLQPVCSWNIFCGYYGERLSSIDRPDEGKDPNTGYYLGFGTLGTALSYKSWTFPLLVSVPFIQQMNGSQNDAGVRVRISIARSF